MYLPVLDAKLNNKTIKKYTFITDGNSARKVENEINNFPIRDKNCIKRSLIERAKIIHASL